MAKDELKQLLKENLTIKPITTSRYEIGGYNVNELIGIEVFFDGEKIADYEGLNEGG